MKYVIGNWKMNPRTEFDAVTLATEIKKGLGDSDFENVSVGVAPIFLHIPVVGDVFAESSILVGAQDCDYRESGAFTGEVSIEQLKDLVDFVIVGHSERRNLFGETDEIVNKKVKAVLGAGKVAILCVGESIETRNLGNHVDFVNNQLVAALDGITEEQLKNVLIAYEPIWAIGTGVVATSEQAKEMIISIREKLNSMYGSEWGNRKAILYGGSSNAGNAEELLKNSGCDGFLVGGASLKAEEFSTMCKIAATII